MRFQFDQYRKYLFFKYVNLFFSKNIKNEKVKAMPNMAKDDLKAKQKIANERQLTINMLIYIGKSN